MDEMFENAMELQSQIEFLDRTLSEFNDRIKALECMSANVLRQLGSFLAQMSFTFRCARLLQGFGKGKPAVKPTDRSLEGWPMTGRPSSDKSVGLTTGLPFPKPCNNPARGGQTAFVPRGDCLEMLTMLRDGRVGDAGARLTSLVDRVWFRLHHLALESVCGAFRGNGCAGRAPAIYRSPGAAAP